MNEEIKQEEVKPIFVDLGVGNKKEKDWIGIDKYRTPVTDIVQNLDDPKLKLPFDNESVSEIRAYHFLEHIHNLFPLMNECYRILKPQGHFDIIVPTGYESAFGDPSHLRAFTDTTFHYFTKNPPGNYHNPEIVGFWKILKNDWSPFLEEDTTNIIMHKRRELHIYLMPEKQITDPVVKEGQP